MTEAVELQTDPNVAEYRKRIRALLTAHVGQPVKCKKCARDIWYVHMHKSGKFNPYTEDGVSHFADCPGAQQFRKEPNDDTYNEKAD